MSERRIVPLVEDIPGLTKIPTDIIFDISPMTVKINKDLPRWRKEMGDVKDLAESIKTKGQIHPILINRNNELVVGGRRLAACIFAGINVKAAYTDKIDPIILRELELEENLRRKNFTPGEEVLAVQELHELKCKQFGTAGSGKVGGWKLEDTAALIGKTKGSVIGDLQLAAAVRAFPELGKATKKNAIAKAVKGLERIQSSIAGIQKHKEAVNAKDEIVQLYYGDSIPFMRALENEKVDILLCDPMYGIDADKNAIGVGGITGGTTSAGFTIVDGKDDAFAFLETLAVESFRFTKATAHGYVFVGPEHFYTIRKLFTDAGWLAYIKPMLWIKRESGQTNVPYAWPASCYETYIYIRKQDSKLVKEGMPDWVECPPVNSSGKIHPYEKPIGLLTNLLERVCYPGQTLYDPCMGSGASIEAGIKQKLFCIGGDSNQEAYSGALGRIAKLGI
jgi:DNA modification methylase